ncbi:hypothetical protein [Leptospira bandrabouensis]|uniref:Uncharacterized protein n=1 Tax=Leptospira bandrabouensis TaxID=2484903 RepID=A0A6H3NQV4_9LEPT|nr:hypothetical protein [Leptospira bandrabouensis]MCG6143002.1 hypothetical protein [Leptospira bandrabouensis]MCG6151966.1 hypothetical protein [Leptospira bandrabouensis]MCG6158661.1 hypothetical protein [Leptospira bandrabouensis]MCG6162597.1 hypothetical protein [Leptospira bandrabouensis]MCW7459907.1 hypothetical protein [Leptospira bandrabouensis]
MKWISSVIIFSFTFGLVAKTTMSYRERKKQLDGKITLVLDIKEQLKLEPETGKTSVETIRSQVEETYRAGNRVEIEKTLSVSEGELLVIQRKLCFPMEESANGLYQKAMGGWILLEGEEKNSAKPIEWDTKEKIQRYLMMAKSEKDHAKEYFLSGNYHLSLHTYKRSLVYSLMSLRSQKAEIPEEYQTADSVWVQPIWMGLHKQKQNTIQEN